MRSNRKVASAKESIRKRDPELFEPGANEIGIASDYISDFRSLNRGQRVVIYCRVSASDQERSKNLSNQVKNLIREVEQLGFDVFDRIKEVSSGWQEDRDGLLLAAKIASENNAVIVAESATRFIRSKDFNSKTNWKVKPTKAEYRRLQRETQGVKLATLVDPDATPQEIRSYETNRGKKAKGNAGGRPRKQAGRGDPERKKMMLPKVKWMLWLGGSLKEMAEILGVSHTTVMNWRNELEERGLNFKRTYGRKIHFKHVKK